MSNNRYPPITKISTTPTSDTLVFTHAPSTEDAESFERNNKKFSMHVSGISYPDLKLPIAPASSYFGIHKATHPNFKASNVDWLTPKPKLPPVKDPLTDHIEGVPLTGLWSIPGIPIHFPKPKPIHIPPSPKPSDPFKPGGVFGPGGPLDPTKPGGILSPTSPINPLNPHSPLNPIINNPGILDPLNPLAPIFAPHDGQPKSYTIPSTSIVEQTLTYGDIQESNLRKTYDSLIDGNLDFKTWVKFVANGIIPEHLKFVPPNLPLSHNVINVLYSLNGNVDKLEDPTIPEIDTHAHIIVNSELGDAIRNRIGTVFVVTDGTTQHIAGQLHDALKFSDEVWVYFYKRNLYVKTGLAPKPHTPQHLQTKNNDCTLL